ncbi:hypothetical protein ACFPM3_20120 [Streptomyces coeruleoprunus]|uniref:Uncharacterized protein n=1 Tax=Streptomyces coeruleoprunus TaxID=285563 RepID=A0ABV9XIF6_9ACTN
MASRLDMLRELMALNEQYEQLTGDPAYLYVYNAGDSQGARFVFTNERVMHGPAAALAHMREVLRQAVEGLEHSAE